MKLSMVVVNYHSSDFVRQCVRNVDGSWCGQVIFVDNSTSEDEARALSEITVPVPTSTIVEITNVGFGTAANHGIDAALAENPDDPVWLVNPDMTFEASTPRSLLDRLSLGVDDLISPAIVTGESTDLRVWFAGGTADLRTGQVVHDDYLGSYSDTPLELPRPTTFMCGAAPVFTPVAWAHLGGFRDDLFLYWEDVELSLRAQDLGLTMTIVGGSPVWHAVGGTGDGDGQSELFYYYSARNRVRVMALRGQTRLLFTPVVLLQLVKFSLRPLRREAHGSVRKFLRTLTGYAVGFRSALRRDRNG